MKTKIQIEHFLGDVMKVVACQLEDLLDLDQLQTAEIIAIVSSRISSLSERKPLSKRRPKPSNLFLKNYHSGNEYSRTKSAKENNTKERLDVISQCFFQASEYDGITKAEFLSLCSCYVREHFSDGEDV